ncbi:MAG: DUF4157 domain-containing protein, partial [Deltaproteobacteria bacterium]|nr:DUF4157 domain-containing protein [Deltaproteobacteria bacterium]
MITQKSTPTRDGSVARQDAGQDASSRRQDKKKGLAGLSYEEQLQQLAGEVGELPHRAEMEARFGPQLQQALAGMTIHTGPLSAELASSMGAQAVTIGQHIVFAQPRPPAETVAHELAHLLQQEKGGAAKGGVAGRGSAAEQEAEAVGLGQLDPAAISAGREPGTAHRQLTATGPVARPDDAKVTIPSGRRYKLTAQDVGDDPTSAWQTLGDRFGLKPENLTVFNVDQATGQVVQLAEGVEIYIPSADEVLFSQIFEQTKDYKAAEQRYGELLASGNVGVMRAARDRASGQKGKGYGVEGVDGGYDAKGNEKIGYFLTPNPTLAGASSKRTETIDGQVNYKVIWVNNWKCNIFMNDTMYQAGYKPAHRDNGAGANKYHAAGKAHESGAYTEVPVASAAPG